MTGQIERFSDTKIWQGADGPIAIREMSDTHLRNSIALLIRNVENLRTAWGIEVFVSGPEPSGEMAKDALASAMAEDARQSDGVWLRSTPLYRALRREQKRRRTA